MPPFLSIFLPNATFKNILVFALLLVSQPSVYGQTVVAPNECSRTPLFPAGTVDLVCPPGEVPVPIFSESFDQGFGVFSKDLPQFGNANELTLSSSGDTPSADTGPETTASCRGSKNDGEFIFWEGSFNIADKSCMSTTVDLSNATGSLALSVWYYMFGDDIGEVEVLVNDTPRFSIAGQQQTANGQAWQQAIVDLNGLAGSVADVQVCIADGAGGDSAFQSDAAVDQVEVYGCGAPIVVDDILDYLPGILATVERRPPPPPPPARWRVTNMIYCPSFKSEWTVSDGTSSRSSIVRSRIIFDSNTSSYATVEAGEVDFTWRLRTEQGFTTCGAFGNQFTRTLKPGYDYEFTLEPAGTSFTIETTETKN